MKKMILVGCVAVLAMSLNAWGQSASINVGTHNVPSGTSTCEIPIMINGGSALTDMVLNVQVADGGLDGGGSIIGPSITAINTLGSIWTAAPSGYDEFSGPAIPQYRDLSVVLMASGESVPASGLLATLVLDVSGFQNGDSFDLLLVGTLGGDTAFQSSGNDVPVSITNGTINITPEPATMSLLGLAALALVRRRR